MLEYPTLKVMRDQVARQIGDNSSDRQTKIDEWINTHYAQLARKHLWPQLMRTTESGLTVSSGAESVYLPKEIETLFFVMPDNQSQATAQALEVLLRNAGPTISNPGTIYHYAESGEFGRRCDFSATPEKLTLTTSGSGSVSAVVHGSVTAASPSVSEQEIREEVTISPSVGVTTTNTFTDVFGIGVATLSSGVTVSIAGTSSGTVYATIGEGENTARYRRIRIMQPVGAANSVTLIWKKRVFRLISDNQAIEIPVGQALVDATIATMMVNQREYNAAAVYHQGRATSGADLAIESSRQQGEQVYLGQPQGVGRTRKIIVVNP